MSDEHHEIAPNPEYDGPDQHCLPPEVHQTFPGGVFFALLLVLIVLGAAWLGVELLAG